MKRAGWVIVVAATLVVILVWFFGFSRPKADSISDTNSQLEDARDAEQSLEATLARLQDLDRRGPEIEANLQQLNTAVPAAPDLADFIFLANDAAADSGVDWISIAPTPPAANPTGGPTVIALSIQVQGGFYQVVDYLNRLEELERLVVADTVSITVGSDDSATGDTTQTTLATSTSDSAAPSLSVSLGGRMFTRGTVSATPGVPGATPETPPPAATPPPSGGTS